jgi:hypothetical protein
VPYSFYVFERYDFTELARDLDGVLRDVEPSAVVSLTHSTVLDETQRVRYSAMLVVHGD